MSDVEEKHDEDCDKQQNYSDGIWKYCLCKARLMNTFVGAHIKRVK